MPYWSVASSGTLLDVGIGQVDAKEVARLRLHDGPGRHAADRGIVGGAEMTIGAQIAVLDQLAGGVRLTIRADRVGAQEHLVRGMRGVGLVLVDERSRGVGVLMHVVGRAEDAVGTGQHGGPRLDHEAQLGRQVVGRTEDIVGAGNERVVRVQRHEDRTIATLGDEIETMVEELAEEGEPGVKWRADPGVRLDVGEEEDRECHRRCQTGRLDPGW